MGRASRVDAARHREEVVAAAARLLRERGSAATSVQDVMGAAGLTHGGFYKHFGSKEELAGVAATTAFDGIAAQLNRIADDAHSLPEARDTLFQEYLTAEHRDSPGEGCANAGLATDAARTPVDGPLHRSYTAGVRRTLEGLELPEEERRRGGPEARRRAIFDLAAMVGALTLARATAGDPLSDEILATVRAELTRLRSAEPGEAS